jgi:prolyl oligopeptidase
MDNPNQQEKAMPPAPAPALSYPETAQVEVSDDYHGTRISDPYRWLEEIRSSETEAWVAQQNTLSAGYLSAIPGRDEVFARLMRLASTEHRGLPREAAGRYFRLFNDGSHDQHQLVVSEALDAAPRLLLDPNTLAADGSVSLMQWLPSKDGTKLLYGLSESGSDWTSWRVRDVASGQDLPDLVRFGKYANAAWDSSGRGFYYMRFPEPQPGQEHLGSNRNASFWHHVLGTSQAEDRLLFALPDEPETGIWFALNQDHDLMLFYASRRGSHGHRVYVLDLNEPAAQAQLLIDNEDSDSSLLGNDGRKLWFRTDHEAANFRIVEVDRDNPATANWRTIVPEQSRALRQAALYGGYFVCSYLEHAASVIELHAPEGGKVATLQLPGTGNVENMQGQADSSEFFLSFTNSTTPETTLRVDVRSIADGSVASENIDPPGAAGFDPERYECRTLFYDSADGTRIPLHMAHRRGITLDGSHPTILYGYGGFGIPQIPKFTPARAAWLELGGVFAIAGIRGGSEYGRAWHHAAIKQNRQNAYDDFIAAAGFLISEGYTSTPRLAIQGRSNGGLLVGAVMAQRPELFAVALPQVGVMDMLRFNQFTAGPHWESDFGSPQNPAEFAAIHAYSPLHNLREGVCYPATLVTTGDTDDRVVPAHSYKFAARLQAVQSCSRPVLIRIDGKAGHGQGKPIAQEMQEFADMYSFTLHNMGLGG